MYSLHNRIKKLESNRAALGSDFCPRCGAYTGTHPTDIKLVPPGTAKCELCGFPRTVMLNLGRKIINDAEMANLNHAEEVESFIEQMRKMTEG